MSERPAPTLPAERLVQLDALRGLAVLGILLVNAPASAMPGQIGEAPLLSPLAFGPLDQAVWWTMRTGFDDKFITLFSLLFGVSVYLVGGESGAGDGREGVLRRRLLWLLLFGALHGALIWYGDILLLYALAGMVMALCRSWPPRRLLLAGAGLIVLTIIQVLSDEASVSAGFTDASWMEAGAAQVRSAIADARSGLAGSQLANLRTWALVTASVPFTYGPSTLGLMMWGLALFRLGVLQGRASTKTYLLMTAAGGLSLAVIGWSALEQMRDGFPVATRVWDRLPNLTLAPVVALGYVGLVNLALRVSLSRGCALALAPVGRMAFTNYIAQSVIMTTVFNAGRGLGLYGRLDWPQWSLIVVGVWVVQLVWSPLWLSRFNMGPLEWGWRRLSYGRPIPLRRAIERPAVPSA